MRRLCRVLVALPARCAALRARNRDARRGRRRRKWSRSTPTAAGCARSASPAIARITGPAWSPDGNRSRVADGRPDRRRDLAVAVTRCAAAQGRVTSTPRGRRTARGSALRRASDACGLRVRARDGASSPPFFAQQPADLVASRRRPRRLDVTALTALRRCSGSGSDLQLAVGAPGAPAWSPDGSKLAFARRPSAAHRCAHPDRCRYRRTVAVRPAASAPRWSPDGASLVYAFVPRRCGSCGPAPTAAAASVPSRAIASATAVDWQPCTVGDHASCGPSRRRAASTTAR